MSDPDLKKIKFLDLHAGERFIHAMKEIPSFGAPPVFVKTSTHMARGQYDAGLVIEIDNTGVEVFAIDR